MIDEFNRQIFARTIWMEARGESSEGKGAVAHSIYNRFLSNKWFGGKTLAAVCLKDQQYSCWNASKADTNREQMAVLDQYDPSLRECLAIVDGTITRIVDQVDGATHYYSSDIEAPSWVSGATLVTQIGKHLFYKDVD